MEKICKVSDILLGTMKGFRVGGKQILIANVDGRFYAMDAVCSHMLGYLPDGKLEKNIVICPVHHSRYDVKTGKLVKDVNLFVKLSTGHGAKDLETFPISIKDDEVYINI